MQKRFEELKQRIMTARPIAPPWMVDNLWSVAEAKLAKERNAAIRRSRWSLGAVETGCGFQIPDLRSDEERDEKRTSATTCLKVESLNVTPSLELGVPQDSTVPHTPKNDSQMRRIDSGAEDMTKLTDKSEVFRPLSPTELFVQQSIGVLNLPQWFQKADHTGEPVALKNTKSSPLSVPSLKKVGSSSLVNGTGNDVISSLRSRLNQPYSLDVYFNRRNDADRSRSISICSDLSSADSSYAASSFELPSRKWQRQREPATYAPIAIDSFDDIMNGAKRPRERKRDNNNNNNASTSRVGEIEDSASEPANLETSDNRLDDSLLDEAIHRASDVTSTSRDEQTHQADELTTTTRETRSPIDARVGTR
jgi:hypothetical protein